MSKNKSVNVIVTFKNGTSKVGQVEVESGPYASMQSRACTKRTSLIAKVTTGKIDVDAANKEWNEKIRSKWIGMVQEPYMSGLPQTVVNEIDSVVPETSVLDLNIPQAL